MSILRYLRGVVINSNKQVYLHIGFGKTGTSSVQRMMYSNRSILEKKGILYPDVGVYDNAHHRLADLPYTPKDMGSIRNSLIRVRECFCKTDYSKLIISSEQLCFSTPELIRLYSDIFAGYKVNVIMYYRAQDKLIESTYLYWMKSGREYGESIRSFFRLHQKSFDFCARLDPWSKCFGQENIETYYYNKSFVADVCAHFMTVVKVADVVSLPSYRANLSLIPECVELVRKIDGLNPSVEEREELLNSVVRLSDEFRDCSKAKLIDANLRDEILGQYHESNARFVEKYVREEQKSAFLKAVKVNSQTPHSLS